MVVVAGYPDRMARFLDSNPGLRSRFPKVIHFPDYSAPEMLGILGTMARAGGYRLDPGARAVAAERMGRICAAPPPGFGNGRFARSLFESAIERHADRIDGLSSPSDDDLATFVADDVRKAFDACAPVPARAA